jgi:uncharacterized protein YndB with AHSA1/START domain
MNDLNINVSKEYKCDAKTLFTAISEGILFKYTGALMDKLQIDFREGGALVIDWGDSKMNGEFKTVKPFEKVVFTWNTYSEELSKNLSTLVTITLKEKSDSCLLTLVHEGIASEKMKADMTFGWNDGLDDMYKSHFKF